ncbi:TPA: type II secretion system protein [Aeromonas salmonicida]|nr:MULTISPECIES: type II secretion system protein [Aeromonas]QLI59071.1 type II secretion system protein [Aeromonas caviae]QLI60299.1 type II secretion system protein [Aeromonas caviae]HDN9373732.1 type II secretion system protein [Aeromonas salmonicida]HDN9378855.1 type II secretion system protein [Aeromonas salmonicida]HDN9389793.1 type II secretion system protein [Aeromonas salmonicida]
MKKCSGYTLIELSVAIAVIATISFGVAAIWYTSDIAEQSIKVHGIASDVNSGVNSALRLKVSGGCLTGISISHADLITTGVPQSSVYPAPWVTSFAFGYRGGEPVYVVVSIDVRNTALAGELYTDSGADYMSGSSLSYQFPIKSPRLSSFGEMYRSSTNCWAHGIGDK